MNKPKLYIIVKEVDSVTSFYNGQDDHFYQDLANATWAKTRKDAQEIIDKRFLSNCKVDSITEDEYIFAKANAMTKITIICDSLSHLLKTTLPNLPNKSQASKNAYRHLKKASESIRGFIPDFEHFAKTREDDVYDVKGYYEEFIHELSLIEFHDLTSLIGLLRAYKKDKKSMIGIAKKILK